MTSAEEIYNDAIAIMPTARASLARRRTLMSRFYYAAFHASRNYAVSLGYSRGRNSESGVHEHLRRFLGLSSDENLREIADALRVLFDRRVIADYHLDTDVRFVDIEDSKELVDLIFSIARPE